MRLPPFAIGSIYIRQQGLPEYATSLSTPIRTDVSVIGKWDQAIKVHLVITSTGTKDDLLCFSLSNQKRPLVSLILVAVIFPF